MQLELQEYLCPLNVRNKTTWLLPKLLFTEVYMQILLAGARLLSLHASAVSVIWCAEPYMIILKKSRDL